MDDLPASTSNRQRLGAFPTATLIQALPGSRALPRQIRPLWSGATLSGPAYPVLLAAGDNLWLHRAIYEAPRESILVVATMNIGYGYWGELMTRAALHQKLGGLVIDGGVRDLDAIETLGFPVFASAICARGTSKDPAKPGTIGEAVRFCGLEVTAGAHVVGDRDGVVVVPAREVFDGPERALAVETREAGIQNALAEGARLLDFVESQENSTLRSKYRSRQ